MEERKKTKSKHFYDDEIIDVKDGIVYLKMYVHRKYPPTITEYSYQNINYHASFYDKKIRSRERIKKEESYE